MIGTDVIEQEGSRRVESLPQQITCGFDSGTELPADLPGQSGTLEPEDLEDLILYSQSKRLEDPDRAGRFATFQDTQVMAPLSHEFVENLENRSQGVLGVRQWDCGGEGLQPGENGETTVWLHVECKAAGTDTSNQEAATMRAQIKALLNGAFPDPFLGPELAGHNMRNLCVAAFQGWILWVQEQKRRKKEGEEYASQKHVCADELKQISITELDGLDDDRTEDDSERPEVTGKHMSSLLVVAFHGWRYLHRDNMMAVAEFRERKDEVSDIDVSEDEVSDIDVSEDEVPEVEEVAVNAGPEDDEFLDEVWIKYEDVEDEDVEPEDMPHSVCSKGYDTPMMMWDNRNMMQIALLDESGKCIVGAAVLYLQGPAFGYIPYFAISRTHRGQGWGGKFVQALRSVLRHLGVSALLTEADKKAKVQRFWRHAGLVPCTDEVLDKQKEITTQRRTSRVCGTTFRNDMSTSLLATWDTVFMFCGTALGWEPQDSQVAVPTVGSKDLHQTFYQRPDREQPDSDKPDSNKTDSDKPDSNNLDRVQKMQFQTQYCCTSTHTTFMPRFYPREDDTQNEHLQLQYPSLAQFTFTDVSNSTFTTPEQLEAADFSPVAMQSGELHTVANAVAKDRHTVAPPGSTSRPIDSSRTVAKVRLYLFLSY